MFVHGFESGARSLLLGALMRPTPPRQRLHTVVQRTTDTRNVDRLLVALEAERSENARLRAEIAGLTRKLAIAANLLDMDV